MLPGGGGVAPEGSGGLRGNGVGEGEAGDVIRVSDVGGPAVGRVQELGGECQIMQPLSGLR